MSDNLFPNDTAFDVCCELILSLSLFKDCRAPGGRKKNETLICAKFSVLTAADFDVIDAQDAGWAIQQIADSQEQKQWPKA